MVFTGIFQVSIDLPGTFCSVCCLNRWVFSLMLNVAMIPIDLTLTASEFNRVGAGHSKLRISCNVFSIVQH